MNLQSPEIPPDQRILRRAWLGHAIENGFITHEQAELWGFANLVEGKIRPPRLRTYPEHGGLNEEERKAIICLVEEGYNASSACVKLDITYKRYKKEFLRDRGFAAEIRAASECMEGYCGEILASGMISSRDPKLALSAMSVLSKSRQANHEAEYRHKEYKIKLKLAQANLRQIQVIDTEETKPDFSMLTPHQFKRYQELNDLAAEGRAITNAEYLEFGQLVYHIIKRASEKNRVGTIEAGYRALDGPAGSGGNGHMNGSNGFH